MGLGTGKGGTTCKESKHNMRRAVCCVFVINITWGGAFVRFSCGNQKRKLERFFCLALHLFYHLASDLVFLEPFSFKAHPT